MSDPEDTGGPRAGRDPSARRDGARRAGRGIGIAALGLVGGLLLGVIVQDVLAVVLLRTGLPLLGFVFSLVVPLFAVLGIVVALVLDHGSGRGRAGPR